MPSPWSRQRETCASHSIKLRTAVVLRKQASSMTFTCSAQSPIHDGSACVLRRATSPHQPSACADPSWWVGSWHTSKIQAASELHSLGRSKRLGVPSPWAGAAVGTGATARLGSRDAHAAVSARRQMFPRSMATAFGRMAPERKGVKPHRPPGIRWRAIGSAWPGCLTHPEPSPY